LATSANGVTNLLSLLQRKLPRKFGKNFAGSGVSEIKDFALNKGIQQLHVV